MKKSNKFWITAIVLCVIITLALINLSTSKRGYSAVGGEYLLVPLVLVCWGVRISIKDFFRTVKGCVKNND